MIEIVLLSMGLGMTFLILLSLAGAIPALVDCVVSSGVVALKRAVYLFAISVFVGSLLQGFMVMRTVGRGIVPEVSILAAFCVTAATVVWVFSCMRLGYEISVTHSIIGAVAGYGLLVYGLEGVNLWALGIVVVSWFTSPLGSLLLAFLLYKLLVWLAGFMSDESADFAMRRALLVGLLFCGYSFGANDVSNAIGIYATIAMMLGVLPDHTMIAILAAYSAVGIAFGGIVIGGKVIETVAYRATRLDVPMGLSAEFGNSLTVYIFTTIPYLATGYGLPISTALASIGSIMGVGLARGGARYLRGVTVGRLVAIWALTPFFAAALCVAMYLPLSLLFGMA